MNNDSRKSGNLYAGNLYGRMINAGNLYGEDLYHEQWFSISLMKNRPLVLFR